MRVVSVTELACNSSQRRQAFDVRQKMAFPKKGLRKITVEGQRYVWSAKGSDMVITLHIVAEVEKGQVLTANFPYLQDETEIGPGHRLLTNQFVITPYTVRQVILHALENGWKPHEGGSAFHVDRVEQKIDLRLDRNKEDRIKQQVESGRREILTPVPHITGHTDP